MPRKVISRKAAIATVRTFWPLLMREKIEDGCGHHVYKSISSAYDGLVMAVMKNSGGGRNRALVRLAGVALKAFSLGFYQEADLSTPSRRSYLEGRLLALMTNKGPRSFISSHEILGVITEEVYELELEVNNNCGSQDMREECMDIALAALFALASIDAGGLEW